MTVLERYQRLEALGLWRPGEDAQRREVVVSIGDATLMLAEVNGRVLTHWSLPAMQRLNPGDTPAIFALVGFPDETLEISDGAMVEGLEAVMATLLRRRRSHPGRLRLATALAGVALFIAVCVLWLPGAMARYAVSVVPDAVRAEAGRALFAEVQRVTGPPCNAPSGTRSLRLLERRLFPYGGTTLSVAPSALAGTIHLPDGQIIMGHGLVEDHDTPEVAAGHILAEDIRRADSDALERLLVDGGLVAELRFLTSGKLTPERLKEHAAQLVTAPDPLVEDADLIARMSAAALDPRPYAFARDVTGQSTSALIEAADTIDAEPVLDDNAWLALQRICEDRG